MGESDSRRGKVVVNRSLSLDGFIAGHPREAHNWPRMSRFVASAHLAEIAAATGAMLIGRRTWEVGDSMEAQETRWAVRRADPPRAGAARHAREPAFFTRGYLKRALYPAVFMKPDAKIRCWQPNMDLAAPCWL